MDPVRNIQSFQEMRILRMVQETRLIAVCEVNETGKDEDPITEKWIVVDANTRPIPVPYSEEP